MTDIELTAFDVLYGDGDGNDDNVHHVADGVIFITPKKKKKSHK